MAADVTSTEVATAQPPVKAPAERRPHRIRFLFIYGLLGAALGASIVAVVIFAGRSIDH